MKDFISEIKKIPTDGLIYCLSEKSIDMFRKNECLMPVTIPVIQWSEKDSNRYIDCLGYS